MAKNLWELGNFLHTGILFPSLPLVIPSAEGSLATSPVVVSAGLLPGIRVLSSPRRRLGDGSGATIFALAAGMSPQ